MLIQLNHRIVEYPELEGIGVPWPLEEQSGFYKCTPPTARSSAFRSNCVFCGVTWIVAV